MDTSGIVTYNNRDGFGAYMIDCEWNIVPSEERPIELKFLKFNIRKTSQCSVHFLEVGLIISLRKHAYSNILRILPPKHENFQMKISDIFHISAQNTDYGYSLEPPHRGGSNEYPQ